MSPEKTFDFDGEHGRNYAHRIMRSLPGYEDLYTMTASYLAVAVAKENAHILVTGAGGGKEISVLSRKKRSWRFTGVDSSEQMINTAQKRLEREGITARLYTGETGELPADALYDAATSLLVLHFLRGDGAKRTFLAEIARRLRPGAPFVLAAVAQPDDSTLVELFDKAWFDFMVTNGIDEQFVAERFARAGEELDASGEAHILKLLDEEGFEPPLRFFTGFRFVGWFTRRKGGEG